MATVAPTITRVTDPGVKDVWLVTWTPIAGTDTCTAVKLSGSAERTVQWTGSFNAAGIAVHGSMDDSAYVVLTDPQGNSLSKTADAIETVTELTRYIKPVIASGTPTSVTVYLLVKGHVS